MLRVYFITAIGSDDKDQMREAYVMNKDKRIQTFASNDAAERWLNINASKDDVVFEIHRGYRKEGAKNG